MRTTNVLVAGAGGRLGRLLTEELQRRGARVRALVRRAPAVPLADGVEVRIADVRTDAALPQLCRGIDVVFSSVGASVSPSPFAGFRTYTRVDAPANLRLLEAARAAGVSRFVYTSLNGGAESRRLDYAEGHERVVDALRASPLAATVLRPTGFFAAMGDLVTMARRGAVPVFGDGNARTNPIDERDLAAIAADEVMATGSGCREVAAGGPEEFSRREIAELAFAVLGKRPRLLPVPVWLAKTLACGLRCVNPRAGHFLAFAAHVMTHPCLAPRLGTRRLVDALRARAQ